MAGRAKMVVDAKELSVYANLVQELEQKGYIISDNSRIKITFLAPYTSRPAYSIESLISKLDRHIAINGNKTVTKKELSKILGISRPTLDRWTERGWLKINPHWYGPFNNGKDFKISLDDIKTQLTKLGLLLTSNDT